MNNAPTLQEVEMAKETYLILKREYEESESPLNPRNVRSALNALGEDSKASLERIQRVEKILFEINQAACEEHGLSLDPDIPF